MRIVAVASSSSSSNASTTTRMTNDVNRRSCASRRPSSASASRAKTFQSHKMCDDVASSVRARITAATLGVVLAVTPLQQHAAFAEFYIEDVPLGLNAAEDSASTKRPSLRALTSGKNGKAIEKCANKCIATCSRGGSHGGAPGLGPMSVRRDPIVFKESFRSRNYCLFECADICAARINGGKR